MPMEWTELILSFCIFTVNLPLFTGYDDVMTDERYFTSMMNNLHDWSRSFYCALAIENMQISLGHNNKSPLNPMRRNEKPQFDCD